MKHEDDFRSFLTETYISDKTKESLSRRAVSNMLSRCRIIERKFNITLPTSDIALNKLCQTVKDNGKLFGERLYTYNQYTYTIRIYKQFLAEFRNSRKLHSEFSPIRNNRGELAQTGK